MPRPLRIAALCLAFSLMGCAHTPSEHAGHPCSGHAQCSHQGCEGGECALGGHHQAAAKDPHAKHSGCPHKRASALAATNEQLARSLFDALSRGDKAALDEMYSDDFRVWTAGSIPLSGEHNREEALAGADAVFTMFPKGIRFDIKAVTAQGERVAVEAESIGDHVSGKKYNNLYHFLVVVRDGKITRLKEYMDTEHASAVLFGE